MTAFLCVYVNDAGATYQRAIEAGACRGAMGIAGGYLV
jgi:hypothetical protein